jgi:hypothetical protein
LKFYQKERSYKNSSKHRTVIKIYGEIQKFYDVFSSNSTQLDEIPNLHIRRPLGISYEEEFIAQEIFFRKQNHIKDINLKIKISHESLFEKEVEILFTQ